MAVSVCVERSREIWLGIMKGDGASRAFGNDKTAKSEGRRETRRAKFIVIAMFIAGIMKSSAS
jgi:hypothetical protein